MTEVASTLPLLTIGYSFLVVLRAHDDEEDMRRCSNVSFDMIFFFSLSGLLSPSAARSFAPFLIVFKSASISRSSL